MSPPAGLTLRAIRLDDAEALTDLSNQPGYRHGTQRLPFQSVQGTRRWLETASEEDTSIVAELEGRIVGSGILRRQQGRRRHVTSLGMGVADAEVGKGIGTAIMAALLEAADLWLDLHRVELTVFADNDRAIRLYLRHGFVREGCMRDWGFREGAYVDCLMMGRIRPR